MVRRLSLVLAVTLASPALGCATADGMQEKLYDATRGYNRALRWGDFDRAAAYLPDPSVDAFLSQTEEVEDKLIIIDYQLSRLKLEKQTGQAASRVEIKWHTDDRLIVEETIVDQTWQFYEGQWFLVDERRARGKPLAIFAETPTDENDEAVPDSPHPYLPGLEGFRDEHEIGLSPEEKRVRDRDRRRARRRSDARSEPPVASHSSPQAFEPAPGT